MGGIERVDSFAMEAVAECLENAVSDIRLTRINWAEQQTDSDGAALDLHAESARLWAGGVVDRLEVCARRARRIAVALHRHQARRLT
jgi:hypothetical protein